jgi:PIN domain nuclease of toxin-antitoxin system
VRLLLDTHVMLWLLEGSERLSRSVRQSVSGTDDVFVSAATVWEIGIKRALGRITLPVDYTVYVERANFRPLPITFEHAQRASDLPRHHDDPFDRMLVAQAGVEHLTLVTADRRLLAYGGTILPA